MSFSAVKALLVVVKLPALKRNNNNSKSKLKEEVLEGSIFLPSHGLFRTTLVLKIAKSLKHSALSNQFLDCQCVHR